MCKLILWVLQYSNTRCISNFRLNKYQSDVVEKKGKKQLNHQVTNRFTYQLLIDSVVGIPQPQSKEIYNQTGE